MSLFSFSMDSIKVIALAHVKSDKSENETELSQEFSSVLFNSSFGFIVLSRSIVFDIRIGLLSSVRL